MTLRKLDVDMAAILDAMDDYGDAPRAFLDVETGEVQPWFDPLATGEEPAFDCDDPRWEEVPRRETRAKIRAMERFVASLDEPDVQERLQLALAGRGAFGRFRAELSRHPDLQAQWLAAEQAELLAVAQDWLRSLGIDPHYELRKIEPQPPPRPTPPKQPQVTLFDLLLLGAPEGKTELIDGRMYRVYLAADAAAARRTFERIAREITEIEGIGWRRRFVEDRDDYTCGRWRLSVERDLVTLQITMPRRIWDEFCRG